MHMIPVEVWNDPMELAAFIRQKGLTALILSRASVLTWWRIYST